MLEQTDHSHEIEQKKPIPTAEIFLKEGETFDPNRNTVIVVPGWSESHTVLGPVCQNLADLGNQVMSFRYARFQGAARTYQDRMRQIEALILEYKLKDVTLVGSSLGVIESVMFAAEVNANIDRVVVCDGKEIDLREPRSKTSDKLDLKQQIDVISMHGAGVARRHWLKMAVAFLGPNTFQNLNYARKEIFGSGEFRYTKALLRYMVELARNVTVAPLSVLTQMQEMTEQLIKGQLEFLLEEEKIAFISDRKDTVFPYQAIEDALVDMQISPSEVLHDHEGVAHNNAHIEPEKMAKKLDKLLKQFQEE